MLFDFLVWVENIYASACFWYSYKYYMGSKTHSWTCAMNLLHALPLCLLAFSYISDKHNNIGESLKYIFPVNILCAGSFFRFYELTLLLMLYFFFIYLLKVWPSLIYDSNIFFFWYFFSGIVPRLKTLNLHAISINFKIRTFNVMSSSHEHRGTIPLI